MGDDKSSKKEKEEKEKKKKEKSLSLSLSLSLSSAGLFPGTAVWIPCPQQVWQAAEVVQLQGNILTLKREEDDTKIHLNLTNTNNSNNLFHLRNTSTWGTGGLSAPPDLTQLVHLHEPAVLNSLHVRFDVDLIYTFTGPILIAVNPFKRLYHLYDRNQLIHYLQKTTNHPNTNTSIIEESNNNHTPHVFATAAHAYRGLCNTNTSQTILISGESGAGKTESTKYVMKFLACAGAQNLDNRSQVENQVLESNPLLEAFGNARTLRNDNSSRFGKFIELQFRLQPSTDDQGNKGRLCGARIQTYLLEKVRVCDQQEGERNYHIFFQLCAAASAALEASPDGMYDFPSHPDFLATEEGASAANAAARIDLSMFGSHDVFRYLTKSSCHLLQGVDDMLEFERTVSAMQTVGISREEQLSLFRIVGGVLYLGNLEFTTPDGNSEASKVSEESSDMLSRAAELLGVSVNALEEALCYRTIKTIREQYRKPLKVQEAEEMRDALSRALYGCTFLRVVGRTNQSIGYRTDVSLFCGVLDIFGFECFVYNSFEQLCINFTNERLQQFFNTFVFKCEEALYLKEDIPWDPLDFPDNQDCVDLIQEKPMGVFSMLDEECMVPQGSDKGFNNKLAKAHTGHKRFGVLKTKPMWFTVHHFAGPVHYCCVGFLDKNKDQLSLDIQLTIKASKEQFVANLFKELLDRDAPGDDVTAKRKRQVTISSEFKDQLSVLMGTIQHTEPHFIRCIKPNPNNAADEFERVSVTEQLRYGGVLQAVHVSRAGYPVRLPHLDCALDYKCLLNPDLQLQLHRLLAQTSPHNSTKQAAKFALERLAHLMPKPKHHTVHSWAVGKTLCFFKNDAFEALQSNRLRLRSRCATSIQARYRGWVQRIMYAFLRRTVIQIQSAIRCKLAKMEAQRRREDKASRILQRFFLSSLCRLRYLRTLARVVKVQSLWRGYKARCHAHQLKLYRSAALIQATWKARQARKHYVALREGAIKTQLAWKRMLARRQLRRLKQEAKEVTGLLAKTQGLQKDLTTEKQLRADSEAHVLQLSARNEEMMKRIEHMQKELDYLQQKLDDTENCNKRYVAEIEDALKLRDAATAEAKRGHVLDGSAEPSLASNRKLARHISKSPSKPAPTVEFGISPITSDSSLLEPSLESPIYSGEVVGVMREEGGGAVGESVPSSSVISSPSSAQHSTDIIVDVATMPAAVPIHEPYTGEQGARKESFNRKRRDRAKKSSIEPIDLSHMLEEVRMDSESKLATKDAAISELQRQLADTQEEVLTYKKLKKEMDRRYQQALEDSSPMLPRLTAAGGSAPSGHKRNVSFDATAHANRWIDIMLVGGGQPGKTSLLEGFIKQLGDEEHLSNLQSIKREEQKGSVPRSLRIYDLLYEGTSLRIVDCPDVSHPLERSGCDGEHPLLKVTASHMRQTEYVVAVYNPTNGHTFEPAQSFIKQAVEAGCRAVLLANTYLFHTAGVSVVNVVEAREGRDAAYRLGARFRQVPLLSELVDQMLPALTEKKKREQTGIFAHQHPPLKSTANLPLPFTSSPTASVARTSTPRSTSTLQHHLPHPPVGSYIVTGHAAKLAGFSADSPQPPAGEDESGGEATSPTRKERMGLQPVMGRDLRVAPPPSIPTHRHARQAHPSTSPTTLGKGVMSSMIDTMKTWLGPTQRSKPQLHQYHGYAANIQLLRASLKGTQSQRISAAAVGGGKRTSSILGNEWLYELRPVQELQDNESAITCVAFGQEKIYKQYCLLACASKDGGVVIYRCYRTEMELRFVNEQDFSPDSSNAHRSGQGDHSNIAIHSRLHGHSRAVTSMFFSLLEDQLVTTSIDRSVRFWQVATGDMLKVFTDSSPALVAAFLPFNPTVFVASNSNAVLRLVSVTNGNVLQKLKVESEVRALRFDDTGLFCLAGTKNGAIHVLEATDASTIRFKFKTQLARGAITCITFVPSTSPETSPCLLVNSCDSTVTIIDCIYGPPSGVLTNLAVRHRVKVAHSLLPLRCCHSPHGGGWLVSASEDKDVYAYSLARGANYKLVNLKHHQAPVLAVAVNSLDTLLVSADSFGRIVLWRRFDFSHLPDLDPA